MDNHINGKCGCPKCAKKHRYSTEEWIEAAKKIHGNKYDYSLSEYRTARDKIKVVCHEKDEFGHEHGVFEIRATNHLSGIGCPKCGGRYQMTKDEFVEKARKVHGDKYDYSNSDYKKSNVKIDIICPKHGVFSQVPSSHLMGCGCPKCNKGVVFSLDEFLSEARKIHGDKYDYSKVEYTNVKSKVEIVCRRHGTFIQTPEVHLRGCGCPKCKSSKLEDIVMKKLNELNLNYVYQSKVLDLGNQTVDFYLEDIGVIIECQGEQHYRPVHFSNLDGVKSPREALADRKKLDKEKFVKATDMGIDIVYFTIPSYFSNQNVDVRKCFYKDKTVFTDKDEMGLYLISKNQRHESVSVYHKINQSIGNIGIVKDGFIQINEYVIKYIDYDAATRHTATNFMTSMSKRKYKPIVIFPDEYHYSNDIVLSKIKHICHIGSDYLFKVYARKCTVKEITYDEALSFLNKNHIQGFVSSTVYLGAFYNGSLVGVMTFLDEGNGKKWNMTRFATDINTLCPGLGGKLFNFFVRNYEYTEIKTFADRRWTCDKYDNLYTKLGFVLDKVEYKDYRYYNPKVDRYKRFHKFGFRKQTLHRKYGLPLSMTETEMARSLGYDRIWDCGLIRYVYRKEGSNNK